MPAIDWGAVGFDPSKAPPSEKKGAIDWDSVNAAHNAPLVPTPELKKAPTGPVGFGDYAQGLGSGLNRGMANVVGMPVDAAANVLDLAKAGIGYATSKVTGHAPPVWTEPYDRTQVPGSGAWIADKMHGALGSFYQVDPNRADDGLVRGLHNFGTGAAAGLLAGPGGLMKTTSAMVGAGIPNVIGGRIAEAYPDEPGWSALASQAAYGAPTLAAKTATGAAAAMAGGREGIQQRIATANQAGNVPLTVGQATGIPMLQGIENIGVKAPFGGGAYKRFADAQASAMQGGLENVAAQIDPNRGASGMPTIIRSGQQIQTGLEGPYMQRAPAGNLIDTSFRKSVDRAEQDAFRAVRSKLPADYRTAAPNSVAQAENVLNPAPNDAGAVNNYLVSNSVANPATAIISGAAGLPAIPATETNAGRAAVPGITFDGLWNIRKQVGEDAFSKEPGIFEPRSKGPMQSLYGPMTEDLRDAAEAHAALPEWQAYQGLVKDFRNMSDTVNPYVKADTPEGAYRMAESDFQANPSRFGTLTEALPQPANDAVAAEIVSRLGKANPGQQGKDADTFNNSNFMTNAAKKRQNDPEAFDRLFRTTSAPTAADQFNALLDTGGLIKDSQGWLNNTSQTAPTGAVMGAASGIATGIADGNLGLLAKIFGGVTTAAQLPKLMTSPRVVNGIANGVEMSPLQRLIGETMMSGAPQQYPTAPPPNYDTWPY